MARNILKKFDVNDYRVANLAFTLLLHYLMKCRIHVLAVYDSEFLLGSACVSSEYYSEATESLKICCHPVDYIVWSVLRNRVYRTKISNVGKLKRRIDSECAALSHAAIELAGE